MRRLINQHPGRGARLALGALPFIALLVAYVIASHLRLAENPNDKLLPSLGTIAETFHGYAFEEDKRSGQMLFWVDTWASLRRIGIALFISAFGGADARDRDRRGAAHARLVLAAAQHRRDDSAARGPADPVHRARARRDREDRADRHRRRALRGARSRAARGRAAEGAAREGADARRLHLADRAGAWCCRRCGRGSSTRCACRWARPGCS